jgi:hypothetical protein
MDPVLQGLPAKQARASQALSPLTLLLRRAAEAAADDAVRTWLEAMADGEYASGVAGRRAGQGEQPAAEAQRDGATEPIR